MRQLLGLGLASFMAMGLMVWGCVPEDDTTGDDDDATSPPADTETPEPTAAAVTIVGSWVSEGSDVAPLLAFYYKKIDATFNENGSYEVIATDKDSATTTLTGTYEVSASGTGNIMDITLYQTSPTVVTSQGIYEIDNTKSPVRMTYEVAQTEPAVTGVTPPTASGGFGSTSSGAYGDTNVQYYNRK